MESRHLLYLQLRKSILESQIMCNDDDLIHLGGLALQAEMGIFFPLSVLSSTLHWAKELKPFDIYAYAESFV